MLVVGLVTAVAVAVESRLSPLGAPVWVAGVAAVLVVTTLADRKMLTAVLLIAFACLAATQLVQEVALVKPVRVFVADLLILPLIAAGVVRLLVHGRLPLFGYHFVAIVTFGVAFTVLGIDLGNEPLDAIGVFRRLCIYPAIYMVAVMGLPFPASAAPGFRRMAITAGLVVAGLSVFRMATGEGYAHDYFEQSHVTARFLSHLEAIAPILALLVVLSENTGLRTRKRARNLVIIWILLLGLVVSNYRAVWGALAVALAVWALVAGRSARRMLGPLVLLLGLALVAAVAVIWITNPDALPLEKFSVDNLQRTSNWRIGSWSRAIEVFLQQPIVGTGFGYHHRFLYLSGENFDVWAVSEGHTIHNDLLWLLTNAGLIGAILIVGFHARWWRHCYAALGRDPLATAEGRCITAVIGCHAGVITIAMFQPVFSAPAAAIAIYLMMAYGSGLANRARLERARIRG
ncbi:MAG: O-antigen ligase family protein [Myxococcota bacterium]